MKHSDITSEQNRRIVNYISDLRDAFSCLEFAYTNCSNAQAVELTSIIGCVARDGVNSLLKLEELLSEIN